MRSSEFGWELGVALLLALMAPFLLWPVEQVLPYSVVVEEIYKGVLVWLIIKGTAQKRLFWVLVTGTAFAVSETLFGLLTVMITMNWGEWGLRWVTTIPMHVLTILIHYWGWGLGIGPLGIIPAMLGHGWFNQLVK